jgi:hypothetical protein
MVLAMAMAHVDAVGLTSFESHHAPPSSLSGLPLLQF